MYFYLQSITGSIRVFSSSGHTYVCVLLVCVYVFVVCIIAVFGQCLGVPEGMNVLVHVYSPRLWTDCLCVCFCLSLSVSLLFFFFFIHVIIRVSAYMCGCVRVSVHYEAATAVPSTRWVFLSLPRLFQFLRDLHRPLCFPSSVFFLHY